MLNAEKYNDEILNIMQDGYYFAVRKDRQSITRCGGYPKCENCIFYGEYLHGCDWSRTKWLLSEYKEPIKLTRLEFEILKLLENEGYKYIVRSQINNIIAYNSVPQKLSNSWELIGGYKTFSLFNVLFQFIKWEDEEPKSIKDVLENCEVVESCRKLVQ